MKKALVCALGILLCLPLILTGCGRKFEYGKVERDSALTGGNLSFVYDSLSHTATFGGEGEVVAFYPKNEATGREQGNRIGLKIYAPSEVKEFSKAKLSFQGTEYTGGSFMQTVYGQEQNYFVLTPLVSKDVTQLEVNVTWTQDAETQTYIIKIAKGTQFAEKE